MSARKAGELTIRITVTREDGRSAAVAYVGRGPAIHNAALFLKDLWGHIRRWERGETRTVSGLAEVFPEE